MNKDNRYSFKPSNERLTKYMDEARFSNLGLQDAVITMIVVAWIVLISILGGSALYFWATHPELTQMQVIYTVLGIGY